VHGQGKTRAVEGGLLLDFWQRLNQEVTKSSKDLSVPSRGSVSVVLARNTEDC